MRGWQYVETYFASLYLLYSFWSGILMFTTAARGKTCRSKKKSRPSPANSGGSRRAAVQLDRPVSGAFCGWVHSVAHLSSYHSVASSWLWRWERPSFSWTLLPRLLLPLLILQYVSCSPGATNVKTWNVHVVHARTGRMIWATRRSRSRSRVQRQQFKRQVFARVRDKEL